MKKIIFTLLISGCILGLSPKIVYSQTLGPEKPNQDLINKPGAGAPIGNQPVKNFSGQTLTNSDGSVRTINDTLGPPAPTSCDSGWVLCNMMKLVEWIADKIGNFILTIASWILWACGAAFNFAITFFVIEMNERINSMGGIYIVWKTLRDLANMFFIFILLVIAIQTILGSDAYKKTLRNIILVALFINFSFFFTSVLIDFSNILALQFYKGFANKDRYDGGISETIVGVLRLGTIYDANPKMGAASTSIQITENNKTTALSASQGWGRFFVTIIGGSILMVVTGGILLASSILIIFRFIELIIILMISPLAFATLVLPGAKGYAWDPWIKKLKTQLIFAPVYFMFLWITIKIITSPGMLQVTEGKSFTAGFQGDARALFGLIAGFVITISMLTYSLTIAKELGAAGSDMAAKVSKGFNNFVRKNTVGLAGKGASWTARNTLGKAAYSTLNSERVKNMVANSPTLSKLVTKPLEGLSSTGFGSKVGYDKALEQRKKEQLARAKFVSTPEMLVKKEGETDEAYGIRVKEAEKKAKERKVKFTNKLRVSTAIRSNKEAVVSLDKEISKDSKEEKAGEAGEARKQALKEATEEMRKLQEHKMGHASFDDTTGLATPQEEERIKQQEVNELAKIEAKLTALGVDPVRNEAAIAIELAKKKTKENDRKKFDELKRKIDSIQDKIDRDNEANKISSAVKESGKSTPPAEPKK